MYTINALVANTCCLPLFMSCVLFLGLALKTLAVYKEDCKDKSKLPFVIRCFGFQVKPKYQILFFSLLNILPGILIVFCFDDIVQSSDILIFFGSACLGVIFLEVMSWFGDKVFINVHVIAGWGMLVCAIANSIGAILISVQLHHNPLILIFMVASFCVLYAINMKYIKEAWMRMN